MDKIPDKRKLINNETDFITTVSDKELWQNVSVKITPKVPHNRPDIIVWDITNKLCYIIDCSCQALSTRFQRRKKYMDH